MHQVGEQIEEQRERVFLCNICKSELEEHCNDWDSFHYCEKCDIDDFTSLKLKPIAATKIKRTTITTEYLYTSE